MARNVSITFMLAIDARDVVKTFRAGLLRRRETRALDGVSLDVAPGTIFGLLGPNGAGKTTLLSILSTLLLPDRGTVRVLGLDVVREGSALRRRLNMASGNASFVWALRPPEVLAFYGRLYGLSGRELRRRVDEIERQIHALEDRLRQLGEALGDPALYADGERARAVTAERKQAEEQVAWLMHEWEELSTALAAAE
jgi:ABC-2 type transport system ATP-binding protein